MMSAGPSQEQWEAYKSMLRELWMQKEDNDVVETKKLKRSHGMPTAKIMSLMRQRYGFGADKNAYDRQFRTWGWRKNATPQEWYIVGQLIKKRKLQYDKDSEVKLNGIVIDAERKAKRPRLGCKEELRLSNPKTWALPESIIVRTPGACVSDTMFLDSLPFNTFLKSAEKPFKRLVQSSLSRDELQSLGIVSANQVGKSTLPFMDCISKFITTNATLPDETSFLQALIYSVANQIFPINSVSPDRIGETEIAKFYDKIKRFSPIFVSQFLSSTVGAVSQTFFAALLGEAIWRDDIDTAEALFNAVDFDINEPLRVDGMETLRLVDLIKSKGMAQLFSSRGGDLLKANQPIHRLLTLSLKPEQRNKLIEVFVKLKHKDISLFRLVQSKDPDLVCLALRSMQFPLRDLHYGLIIASMHKDSRTRDLLMEFIGSDWASNAVPEALAVAASHGSSWAVKALLSAGARLERLVAFYGSPSLIPGRRTTISDRTLYGAGTALQHAIMKGHKDIARALLEAGASPDKAKGSTLPSPLQLSLMTGQIELAHTLLDYKPTVQEEPFDRRLIFLWRSGFFPWGSGFPFADVSPIYMAVTLHSKNLAIKLLNAGFGLDTSSDGFPLLVHAILCGADSLVRELLSRGAQLTYPFFKESQCGGFPTKPVHSAVVAAIKCKMFDMVRISNLTADDVNATQPEYESILTPLTAALGMRDELDPTSLARLHDHELVKHLVIDLDARVADSEATPGPWLVATLAECPECVELLLARGASPANELKSTSWEDLFRARELSLIRSILEQALLRDVGTDCGAKVSCLREVEFPHYIARQLVVGLFGLSDEYGYFDWSRFSTILGDPPESECTESELKYTCTESTEYSSNMKLQIKTGVTLLSKLRVDWGCSCMVTLFREVSCDGLFCQMMNILLDLGVKIQNSNVEFHPSCCAYEQDKESFEGFEVLHQAIKADDAALVKRLIRHGADPSGVKICRPEEEAIEAMDGRCTTQERTPLQEAAQCGSVEILQELSRLGANIHRPAQGYRGRTALQEAVQHEQLEAMRYLLGQGVSLNEPPAQFEGYTALQLAAAAGKLDMAYELLEAGADVNAPRAEWQGRTALEAAAEAGRLDVVQLLINAGADISDSNFGVEQFTNAVKLAREKGFPVLVKLLKEQKALLSGEHFESHTSEGRDKVGDCYDEERGTMPGEAVEKTDQTGFAPGICWEVLAAEQVFSS